ncbi:MAG: YihY family inner membrane protein [Gallionella sp.]
MQKNWRDAFNFIRFIAMRFSQDRCAQIAASLTFTTLLSIVPLITIALTMFSAFPVFQDFSNEIKAFLVDNLMPEKSGTVITKYVQQFAESATRLTAVGIIFLTVTAMLMMLTIDHAFNVIWRVSRPRPLMKRLVIYWAVITLSPLLIGASLSLTSWLVGLSMGYAKHIPVIGVGALKILPVMFTTLAFALLYQLVPNRYVPRTHAWTGAIIASIMFESMNRIFGYYISHFPSYKLVYGAFASVPIFLLWIYLSWFIILVGALITASLSHWRAPLSKHHTPTAQLLDALRVLRVMVQGLQHGTLNSLPVLSKSLHLGYDALEVILEKLASEKIVRKAEGQGWLLLKDASHIQVNELLNLFVLNQDEESAESVGDPLRMWLENYLQQMDHHADISLQELLVRSAR